jgi:hypothetical protein
MQPNPIAGSEEPTTTDIIMKQDPVIGVSTEIVDKGDVSKEAAEDVRRQQEGMTLDQYMASASDKDYMIMSALKARSDAGDDKAYMQMMAKLGPTAQPGQTVKPFTRQEQTFIPQDLEDPYKVDKAKLLAESKQKLDGFLMDKVPDSKVRQILVDNINMGDFSDILGERLAESGRGTVQLGATLIGQSPINTAAKYGFFAWQDWVSGKTASFGAAYKSYDAQIKAESQEKLNNIANVVSGPTLGMAVQDFLEKKLEEQKESGELTEQEYNTILFDETGAKRRFMSDEDAQATLSYSFDQMSEVQQFGAIAIENLVNLAGFGAGRAAAGRETLANVKSLQNKFADLTVKGQRIGDVTDPKEVVRLLEIDGKITTNVLSKKRTRINMKSLQIGLREERLDRSLDRASQEVQNMGAKLEAMRRNGVSTKDPDYISLLNQYESGGNRILRAKFRGRTMPLVAENIENSLVVSMGQYYGREYLPGWTGMDADTSEMVSALVMSVGGYKPVKAVGAAVGNRVMRPFDLDTLSIKSSLGRTMDYIGYVATGGASKSLFTDDSIRAFEAATGTKLTASEMKGLRYATRLVQNMDDDQIEVVVKAADDYLDLQERIVNSFPPAMQAQAQEAFQLSFAEASALGPLAGLSALATSKVDARRLNNLNGSELFDIQRKQELQIERSELALNNLEAMVGNLQDEASKQAVLDFVNNGKQAIINHRNKLNDEAEQNLTQLDEIQSVLFDDVSVELPEDAFENLFLLRKSAHQRLGRAFDDKQEIIKLQTDFEEGFAARMDVIAGFRGRPEHEQMLRAETEAFINTHMGVFKARGRAAYEEVVAFAEGRDPIDITPLVKTMLNKMEITDIERFFAPGGEFLNGKMGGHTFEVMNNMVKRVINPEEMTQMRSLLKGSDEFAETPNVVDGLSDLEVALRIDSASSGMNIFAQANPYEIEVMRRGFRDYAGQLKEKNPALSREYKLFERDLDTLIRTQDKPMHDMLVAARKTYQSEVGQRMRNKGFLTKLDKSRDNDELVISQGGMKYRYADVTPTSVFDPVTKNIAAVASGGTRGERAKQSIRTQLDEIMIEFGERTEEGNVFDLTMPESNANFQALSRLLRERAYADWAGDVTKNMQRSAGDIRTRNLQERLGGYDFARSQGWDDVQDAFMVDVLVNKNGQKVKERRSLVNLDALISQDNDIDKLIQNNAQTKVKFDEFKTEVTNATSQFRMQIKNDIQKQQTIFDNLKDVFDTDPDSFYNKFVVSGTEENMAALRDLSVNALVRGGTAKSRDEAAAMFDTATRSLVSRALLNKSRANPVQGSTVSAVKSDKRFVRTIADPNIMLQTIDDNREVLTSVLGDEHIGYLEDIAEFMNKSEPSLTYNFEGVVRGYGTNELLSRIYNMARGMVSPLYVTSEFAVRLASQANVQILQLAGENRQAARIITNMMNYPELVTRKDMNYINDTLKEFVITEITRTGADPTIFFPSDEEEEEPQQTAENEDIYDEAYSA